MSVVAVVMVVCGFAGVAEAARGDGLRDVLGQTGMGLLVIGMGLFSIGGGVFAWPFFMNHRKARFMVGLIGESGARGFYVVLGVVICVVGVVMMTVQESPKDASAADVTSSR
jgi:hypothetical protein